MRERRKSTSFRSDDLALLIEACEAKAQQMRQTLAGTSPSLRSAIRGRSERFQRIAARLTKLLTEGEELQIIKTDLKPTTNDPSKPPAG